MVDGIDILHCNTGREKAGILHYLRCSRKPQHIPSCLVLNGRSSVQIEGGDIKQPHIDQGSACPTQTIRIIALTIIFNFIQLASEASNFQFCANWLQVENGAKWENHESGYPHFRQPIEGRFRADDSVGRFYGVGCIKSHIRHLWIKLPTQLWQSAC